MIIKVCVTRHFVGAREEGVGQRTTPPIKRVPVVMHRMGKRHSDVTSSVVSLHLTETQWRRITPGFEGMSEDCIYQIVGQVG